MTGRERTQRKLKSELDRLKRTFGLGQELEVAWLPGHIRRVNEREILGEISGRKILIYAKNETTALEVLRHEILEYSILSEFTLPYKRLVNALLSALEEQAYSGKEELVKKLTDLIWGEKNHKGVEK